MNLSEVIDNFIFSSENILEIIAQKRTIVQLKTLESLGVEMEQNCQCLLSKMIRSQSEDWNQIISNMKGMNSSLPSLKIENCQSSQYDAITKFLLKVDLGIFHTGMPTMSDAFRELKYFAKRARKICDECTIVENSRCKSPAINILYFLMCFDSMYSSILLRYFESKDVKLLIGKAKITGRDIMWTKGFIKIGKSSNFFTDEWPTVEYSENEAMKIIEKLVYLGQFLKKLDNKRYGTN
jgi:hypothetical protein